MVVVKNIFMENHQRDYLFFQSKLYFYLQAVHKWASVKW